VVLAQRMKLMPEAVQTASRPGSRAPLKPLSAHREKLFPTLQTQRRPVERKQRAQRLLDRSPDLVDGLLRRPLCPAERLRYDLIDDPQPLQILGSQPQRFRCFLRVLAIPPKD